MTKRWACLAALCVTPLAANAGTFNADGVLVPDPAAVVTVGFESVDALVAGGAKLYNRQFSELPSTAADIAPHLVGGDGKALEGDGYFYVERVRGGASYLALKVPAVDGRVEVRLWTLASPSTASLTLMYDSTVAAGYSVATITAQQTGRTTSDGWVELSSGPVDARIFNANLSSVLISGGFGGMVVDALEVVKVGGRMFADNQACTQATLQEKCGAMGECIFGTCVEAAAVWGQVPLSATHRREYTQRLAHLFETVHANRSAVTSRLAGFKTALASVATEQSPRIFWSTIHRAVHDFRDQHTNAPSAGSYMGSLPSTMTGEGSGALSACFGLTELDLRGGGRGYTVFRAAMGGGGTGVQLNVGDILDTIDGEPANTWLKRAVDWGMNAPSDPGADAAWLATDISGILSTRASTLTVLRCESATTCSAPTQVTVPVASLLKAAIERTGHISLVVGEAMCDGRFKNSVSTLAPPDDQGNDVVSTETVDGVTTFQFNGFSGSDPWTAAFTAGAAGNPAKVVFDARLGNGGTGDLAQFLMDFIRDGTSPVAAMGVARPWQALDPEGYYAGLAPCMDASPGFLFDACTGSITFKTHEATASLAGARIAWLNSADVSANDYVPRFVKGRANLRMFAPGVTSGAFGAIASLPALTPAEISGGTMQIHDTRFATGAEFLSAAPYESGTGVPPDEVVIQTLSDALNGKDTMVARAIAWLKEAP